jgi:hypothetical protein
VHPREGHQVQARGQRDAEVEVVGEFHEGDLEAAEARELVHEGGEGDPEVRLQLEVVHAHGQADAEDVRGEDDVEAGGEAELELEHHLLAVAAERLDAADGGRGGAQGDLLEADPGDGRRDRRAKAGLDALLDRGRDRGVEVRPERVEELVEPRRAIDVRIARPPRQVVQRVREHLGRDRERRGLAALAALRRLLDRLLHRRLVPARLSEPGAAHEERAHDEAHARARDPHRDGARDLAREPSQERRDLPQSREFERHAHDLHRAGRGDGLARRRNASRAREDVWERARGGRSIASGESSAFSIRRFAPTEIRAVEPRFLRKMAVFL